MTVYSHTMLSQYLNCPAKCRAMYFDKTYPKFKATKETQWGRDCHDGLAAMLRAGVEQPANVAKAYSKYALPYIQARDNGASMFIERELTVNRDWQPCGRWADDAYIVGKPDVLLVKGTNAFIPDWKTGNVREDPAELELFACLVKAYFPQVRTLQGQYIWLKTDEVGEVHYLSDVDTLRARFDALIKNVEADEDFEPNRTPLCFWCELDGCPHWEWGQEWGRKNGRTK